MQEVKGSEALRDGPCVVLVVFSQLVNYVS